MKLNDVLRSANKASASLKLGNQIRARGESNTGKKEDVKRVRGKCNGNKHKNTNATKTDKMNKSTNSYSIAKAHLNANEIEEKTVTPVELPPDNDL